MANAISTIKSYPERIFSFLPLPFWLPWLLVWVIIFSIDFYIAGVGTHEHSRVTELGVTLFYAAVCISLGLSTRIMANLYQDMAIFIDDDPENLKLWYVKKLKWIFQGIWPLIIGVSFAALVEVTVGPIINSYNQESLLLMNFRSAYRVVGFFFLGLSLWSLANVLILPSQLLRFKFKLQLSNLSGIGLQSVGKAFFKMALTTIVCFTLLVCTIIVSPLSNDTTTLTWVGFGSVVLFCFFLLPQIGVHQIMAIEKRQQILTFSAHLETAIQKSQAEPTLENIQKLRELFELQKHLKDVNDWPFNVTLLWQLISALLIPFLLVILQIILKV